MTASPLWRPATNLKPHMCNSAPSQSHEGREPSQLIPPKLAVSLVRMIFIKFKRRARYSLPCKPSRSTWNERTPATAAAAFARSSPGTRTSTSSNRAGRRRPRSCRRRKRRRPSLRSSLAEAWRTTRSSRTGSASASSTARTWGEMDSERPKAGFVGPEQIVKFEVYCYGTRDRKVSESSPKWGRVQARSQGLRFGREKHIFRGARFLFSSYVWSSFFWTQQNLGSTAPECSLARGPVPGWVRSENENWHIFDSSDRTHFSRRQRNKLRARRGQRSCGTSSLFATTHAKQCLRVTFCHISSRNFLSRHRVTGGVCRNRNDDPLFRVVSRCVIIVWKRRLSAFAPHFELTRVSKHCLRTSRYNKSNTSCRHFPHPHRK